MQCCLFTCVLQMSLSAYAPMLQDTKRSDGLQAVRQGVLQARAAWPARQAGSGGPTQACVYCGGGGGLPGAHPDSCSRRLVGCLPQLTYVMQLTAVDRRWASRTCLFLPFIVHTPSLSRQQDTSKRSAKSDAGCVDVVLLNAAYTFRSYHNMARAVTQTKSSSSMVCSRCMHSSTSL